MRPRELLLHPVPLVAIALLVANDHGWKAAYGGWWTGKLSDAAGLCFFPLLLAAVVDLVRRGRGSARALVGGAAAVTAVGFALVKTVPAATLAFRWAIGGLQWPVHAARALLAGAAVHAPVPVEAVTDPSDLLALPFAAVAVLLVVTRRVATVAPGHRARHPA